MKNINQETRRQQNMRFLAILAILAVLAAVGGGGWLYLDYVDREKHPVEETIPAPDMTGVVDENLTGKVQTAAIEEAQKLNKETLRQMKDISNRLDDLGRENAELKETLTRLRQQGSDGSGAGQTGADGIPRPNLPGADGTAANGTTPAPGGQEVQTPDMRPDAFGVQQPGMRPGADRVIIRDDRSRGLRRSEFAYTRDEDADKPRYKFPYIPSGSFSPSVTIEGADANASITGANDTAPMQLRITGVTRMPNDQTVDLTGAAGMALSKDALIAGDSCSGNGSCIGTFDNMLYEQWRNGSSRMTLTLVMRISGRKWEPRIEWTENCPFSKGEYELKKTECTEPGGTKTVVVDGVSYPVTLGCWRYEDTYRSQEATEGTCAALKNDSACTRIGVECSDSDGGICYSQKEIWQCQSASTGKGQVCGDELFCQDGSCVESQAQTNNHFAEAVSALAALAAAGEDAKGDSMDVRVFTGKGQSCRKAGLGFSNCCQSGGWGNSVGLAHCSDEEKALGKAREKGLTIQVGTYCSKKVLGACLQKKTSYCLFDSKLAQIGQEQGRKGQLGIGFGVAKSPDCRGMTVDELSKLRFDNMDFSAFFDELATKSDVPQDQQLLDRVNNSLKGFSGKFDPDKNQNPSTPIN